MLEVNISMPPELMKIVQDKVSSGLYSDASEVFCDAIRQFDSVAEFLYQIKLDRLKAALAVGIEQVRNGEYAEYSMEEVIAELNNNPAT